MLNQKLIMIVDDDADDRLFFHDAVSKLSSSYSSIEAQTGDDAFDKLQNTKEFPKYIFLDLNMPGMHGIDFMRKLNENGKFKDIAIIIYSTSTSEEDMKATRDLGAKYYLPKSSDISKLPVKIRFAIDMVEQFTTI